MFLKPFVLVSFMLALSDPTAASPFMKRSTLNCCATLVSAQDPAAQTLLSLLGVVVDPSVQVGLTCSPVIESLRSSCSGVFVNCDEELLGGLICIAV
ncbi:fruiting body protein SC3 [Favolaschia claudopus]|uniref:Hydrophobin n=1 Tax=Favolaschia claudopus TaxID=2862362 RepID=A0AAW0AMM8_9AGAR